MATGRGLDGRMVARGRHAAGTRQAQAASGSAAVQARLGRRRGGKTGKPTAQIEPKSRIAGFWLIVMKCEQQRMHE